MCLLLSIVIMPRSIQDQMHLFNQRDDSGPFELFANSLDDSDPLDHYRSSLTLSYIPEVGWMNTELPR